MKFADFISPEAIRAELVADGKEGVIREMVQALLDAGRIEAAESESIVKAILSREELGSTGIGRGVAVPHTKHGSVEQLVGTVGVSRDGVDFDSLDAEKVQLLFLLISPPDRPGDHLRALESISRQLRDDTFCRFLKRAQSAAEIGHARATGTTYVGRVPAVAAGVRRVFDVIDASSGAGSAGMAIDRTEAETLRGELVRMIEAHRRVLDQLATGVAVFNIDRKLTFYNAAFRSLFELDAGFLDQTPTDAAVLDILRVAYGPRLKRIEDLLAVVEGVHDRREGAEVQEESAEPQQVARDPVQLGGDYPDVFGPGRGLDAGHAFDETDEAVVVHQGAHIVQAGRIGQESVPGPRFGHLLLDTVAVADYRFRVEDIFAVHLQQHPQHPVGAGMLRAHVQVEAVPVLFFRFRSHCLNSVPDPILSCPLMTPSELRYARVRSRFADGCVQLS